MPEMASIHITGLKDLEKKMIELGPKIAKKALKVALVAGAREVRKEALTLAPEDTGRLKKAMYIKKMNKPNPFAERVLFGVRHGKKLQKVKQKMFGKRGLDAYYWTFQEFGTKFVKGLHFVEEAFKRSRERAAMKFKEALATSISKIVRGVS